MIGATLTLLYREIKKWVNRKPVFVVSLITPIIWIALFGKSLNLQSLFQPPPGVAQNPAFASVYKSMVEKRMLELFGTTDYFTYMSSGMLVAFSLFQGLFSGVSIIFDKRLGYLDRLLVTPIPRISIWASKILAVIVRVTVLSTILLVVAIAMGMQLKEGIGLVDLLGAWLVIVLVAAGISSLYAMISFYASHQEVVFTLGNLLNLPLMFASSALFPVEQMPSWMQKIAKANPVTYAADLVRHYLIGRAVNDYWKSIGLLVALVAVLLVLSAWLSVRWMESR
ncbi:MAG: ABC transporter permease [Desulfurococcales archaeon]|nr:ABC transporter permease [Desulfurococcales archaeon]